MKEFSDRMQVMNAMGYRGIFEAAGHKLNDIGGVMLWKLNAAYPSVVWQVYDWFLMPNAGYYFMQNACEPVHIQFNPKDRVIEYINRTYKSFADLKADIKIFSAESRLIYSESETVSLEGPSSVGTLSLAETLDKNPGVSFIVLNLFDKTCRNISHNVYWYSASNYFTVLNSLSETNILVRKTGFSATSNEKKWNITISNPSGKIAFFINPRLMMDGEEITPSFWSANYFTLAPGESMNVSVGCPAEKLGSRNPVLRIEGWNILAIEVEL